jgi:hypothetical protein
MTGIKAMIVVNVVIKQGRIRFMPASTMAYLNFRRFPGRHAARYT